MVPGLPLALLLLAPARAGVVSVPALSVPLAPTPVVAQLQLDLAILNPSAAIPALTPSILLPSVQAAVAAPVPVAASPVAAVPRAEALNRVQAAREILPANFAELPAAERDAALESLWDGWKARGLVEASAGPSPADDVLLAGVDDKALTSANKSVFLGAAVLGYPLADSLWLQRTRIGDALDENALRYPSGQRWHNASGTPEFLGISAEAQPLVDAWGAATEQGKRIVAQVRAGSKALPESAAVSREASAAFASVAAELKAAGDEAALDYLSGQDPTFSAFLLDARKPGYYMYNGDSGAIGRILATKAAAALGLRRVLHPDPSLPGAGAVYLYRPARLLERLRALASAPVEKHDEAARARLAAYAGRLAPHVGPAPKAPAQAPWTFAAADALPGSALGTDRNKLSSYKVSGDGRRWDLPLTMPLLRPRLEKGEPHGSFDSARWESLEALYRASAKMKTSEGGLRVVSESYHTRGALVAAAKDGAVINMALLDELARLRREDAKALPGFLRFAAAAVDGALP
ncbi:MAG: hypothetical protein M0D55_03740 [Elusimicrobiota bacterium]|nr:MAG: hypothetical protein M0D55_03740 [Elusimicrobiota bacterium]